MSQSSNLFRLQQIDSQIDQIRTRIAEIEKILTQDEELQQAQSALDGANQALSEQQKLLRHAEDEVKTVKLKLEQTEASLYGGKVRNPKELQDLQAESAALKRHLATLEDRELEAMLSLETAEDQASASGTELIAVQSRLAGQFALLNGEKSSLTERLDRLETDRQVAAGMLAGEALTIYEQLRKQRRGIAVAKAVDRSCSACGSALSPSLIQQALSAAVLVRCPTCGRIIYPG
jgi:predicted  nucleic acid-binding Zn-ribbon protein